ncbi:hypothetical protein [Cellulomonas fimi]|uniref:Uncharacterized protein n=1 Tax=Cellulomonas fimi (strain ATCC 484 / DSM 20113 / JCM 1341 / CCUG 24087 / LMG 16345 / NBRC 15513 / NCIMB 8980 / NCTC 7547 / NRS-133) TaxID=590998 RepID=F4H1U6_CELFA|nr:hypothetical protein [Cellulomonas fimi]AEE47516.1 hypothetical protein Celf_3403 [Cellulomonas fimi ATCC 484]NNH05508.1 hypothetical protein [Cellulomonas fimi]VEH36441.1 Uncharacterised protein [Cellulomonas fimi]
MTAATPAVPAKAGTGYLVGQVWPTARWLLRMHVYLAVWFWAIAVVVVTAATVITAVVGEPHNSILAFARQGAIWFPFSVFIIVSGTYFPVHVATGLTRRSLSLGATLAAAVTALLYGTVFVALLLVERAVFGALGWQWRFFDDMSAGAEAGTFVPASILTFLVAYLSGLLVGMAYLRGGGWVGTLTLPLTVGPILLVSGLFSADAGPVATESWFGGRALAVPVAVAAALAVAAVMAVAFDRLARDAAVPVRSA